MSICAWALSSLQLFSPACRSRHATRMGAPLRQPAAAFLAQLQPVAAEASSSSSMGATSTGGHTTSAHDCQQLSMRSAKSLKRRAAEALLEARFLGSSLAVPSNPGCNALGTSLGVRQLHTSTAATQHNSQQEAGYQTDQDSLQSDLDTLSTLLTPSDGGHVHAMVPHVPHPFKAARTDRPPAALPPQSGGRVNITSNAVAGPAGSRTTTPPPVSPILFPQAPALAPRPQQPPSTLPQVHLDASRRNSGARTARAPPLPVVPESPQGSLPGHSGIAQGPNAVSTVRVAACEPSCPCHAKGWCSFSVDVPGVDWRKVFADSPTGYARRHLGHGHYKYFMGQGLTVHVVQEVSAARAAMQALRQSMQDPVIAIDLEWKPDRGQMRPHKVATLQLSSATTCVIIHTAAMDFKLPYEVKQFMGEAGVVMVGFAWSGADEGKMQASFRTGKSDFHTFYDLLEVANELGYPAQVGLAHLTQRVLGQDMGKDKAVSRSNWAVQDLSLAQIKYAAIDVFATGQVFRGLRLWHSSPAPCAGCKEPVGAPLPAPPLVCVVTGRAFRDYSAYMRNCQTKQQPIRARPCTTCGRLVRVPDAAPAKASPAASADEVKQEGTGTVSAPNSGSA